MRHIDADLGRPLPEKSYGGNCLIYDKDVPEDPYHNFWVLMHIILFFCTLILTIFGKLS